MQTFQINDHFPIKLTLIVKIADNVQQKRVYQLQDMHRLLLLKLGLQVYKLQIVMSDFLALQKSEAILHDTPLNTARQITVSEE